MEATGTVVVRMVVAEEHRILATVVHTAVEAGHTAGVVGHTAVEAGMHPAVVHSLLAVAVLEAVEDSLVAVVEMRPVLVVEAVCRIDQEEVAEMHWVVVVEEVCRIDSGEAAEMRLVEEVCRIDQVEVAVDRGH